MKFKTHFYLALTQPNLRTCCVLIDSDLSTFMVVKVMSIAIQDLQSLNDPNLFIPTCLVVKVVAIAIRTQRRAGTTRIYFYQFFWLLRSLL